MHAIAHNSPTHQAAIVEAGAIDPLVKLLWAGGSKVQEEAAAALAAIDADPTHQEAMLAAGCITPLVGMLRGSSVTAQASAARALANAAAYDTDGQNTISGAGCVPTLLILLSVGKAQTSAAYALAMLARFNPETQRAILDAGGIAPLLVVLVGRNLEAQVQAANALAELARDNPRTQFAIAQAGGIGPLLALLASRSSVAQAKGMAALAQLSRKNKTNQDAIATQGGLKPLVMHLSIGNDPDVQAYAAFALMEVCASNRANQRSVVDGGGITQLAALMKAPATTADVKAEAAGALWALSEAPVVKVDMAEAHVIKPLVQLLGSGGQRAHSHSANALSSLAFDNGTNQVQITQMLIELLSTGVMEAQVRAVQALWRQVHENPTAHERIAKAGDAAALVELLKTGTPEGKDYATWSFSKSITSENQQIFADSGGVEPLVDQLRDPRPVIQDQAAEAVALLALDNVECQNTICKKGGVVPLIRLLTPSDPEDAKCQAVLRSAAGAVANLAVQPAARDQIVSAGGIAPLVQLLGSPRQGEATYAATAIARLSKDQEAKQAAVGSWMIAPLVTLLDGQRAAAGQTRSRRLPVLFWRWPITNPTVWPSPPPRA